MRQRKNHQQRLAATQHQVNLRLERWHRRSMYAVCAWLAATGLLWLSAHFMMRSAGEFGETIHPLEPWSMKLHGAGAMIALFFVGSLMNSHIRRAIRAGRNLESGWSMIAVLLALVITGYGLYYLASENSRPIWSAVHWIIGLAFPLVLILHIVLGKKSSRPGSP